MTKGEAQQGYLTIFLTMTLTVMISLCLTIIEGVRQSTSRLETECAADIGFGSVLAEYHRELLRQYDVFFIDTSYGTDAASLTNTEAHLLRYVNYNLNGRPPAGLLRTADFLQLQAQDAEILQASAATDDGGKVLRRQAVAYIYHKTGLGIAEQVLRWSQQVEGDRLLERDVEAERMEAGRQLEQWKDTDGKEIINPVGNVPYSGSGGILNIVTEGELSMQTVHKAEYVSERDYNRGTGINPDLAYEETFLQSLLFDEYILDKTGCYGAEKENSPLKYQTEYILVGRESDVDNLKAVAWQLLALREAANMITLSGDEEKKLLVKGVSAAVTTACMIPEAAPILEACLLLSWACAESIYDVKKLFAGNKVPLIKDTGDWHCGWEALLHFGSGEPGEGETANGNAAKDKGLRYQDYLRIFLSLHNMEQNTFRLMDIMEMDIRQTEGNAAFRMDACVDSITAQLLIRSRYGQTYSVKKRYGY